MPDRIFNNIPKINHTYNVTRMTSATNVNSLSFIEQTTTTTAMMINNISSTKADISPIACFGFTILILATVGGNTLVLLALFLDKRLHSPSFYLIANMAIADLLLGKRKFSIDHVFL